MPQSPMISGSLVSKLYFPPSTLIIWPQIAPQAWYQWFSQHALCMEFYHSLTDSSLFIYHHGVDIDYLLLYFEDIVLTASSQTLLQSIIT